MGAYDRVKGMPKKFEYAVVGCGSVTAIAPTELRGKRCYTLCWTNGWLIKRLYNQWRYAHAEAIGKKPVRSWFWSNDGQEASDWKTTAMRVMNAEYAGNATYEWFDSYEWFDREGDKNVGETMHRVNQFDRINDTADPRLDNPALDYIFSHPEMTIADAWQGYRRTLEKKN